MKLVARPRRGKPVPYCFMTTRVYSTYGASSGAFISHLAISGHSTTHCGLVGTVQGDLREYMSARTTELPRFHGRLPYPMACSDGHPLIVSQCLQGDILPIVRVGLQHFADEQAKFPDIECHSSTIRGSIGFNSYQPPLHLTSDNICLPEVNPSVRLFFLPCLLWRELEKFLLNGHKRVFAFE